jgi:hypothetical protein
MRHLLLTLALLPVLAGQAPCDETRTAIGDVPRTYTHFMNAQEAAFCRANAATGGVAAYFFNPAVLSEIDGISGQATVRFNIKSREYLPSEGTTYLDVDSDDTVLFSQAVAAKRTEMITFGFGYSTPAYRSLTLSGVREDDSWGVAPYDYTGEFSGSLRHFEFLAALRIGTEGKGGIGVAAGISSFDESTREQGAETLSTASLDGMAASVALGFVFDATDMLTFGAGYRFGAEFDVDGEWNPPVDDVPPDPAKTGTVKTAPVAVGGVRVRPTENYTIYLSYIQEGWDGANASFAAYYPTGECPDCGEEDGRRDEFGEALGTIAVGAEGAFLDGRLKLRAGFSKAQNDGFDNDSEPEYRELVPDYAAGLGGTWRFEAYSVDLGVVREEFADGDTSGEIVNTGVYLSVGYYFE